MRIICDHVEGKTRVKALNTLQGRNLFVRQLDTQSLDVVLQLFDLSTADNGENAPICVCEKSVHEHLSDKRA